jgi:hypothetical protein
MKANKELPIYHIGTYKKNSKTVILQAVKDKDMLSNELIDYYGEHLTTKKMLKENKDFFLKHIQSHSPLIYDNFKYIIVE